MRLVFCSTKINELRVTVPKVTEITVSRQHHGKGLSLLSSHITQIIAAGLIFPHLHNANVAQLCGWASIKDTAVCIILIIKARSYGKQASFAITDWHLPSKCGLGKTPRHSDESGDVRATSQPMPMIE